MYLFNPPLALYLSNHPHSRPRSMWLGIVLVAAGLCGAAFANQAWVLILCQGVLYALGGSKSSALDRIIFSTCSPALQSLPLLSSHSVHVRSRSLLFPKSNMLSSISTGSNGGNCVEDWHQEFSSPGQVSRVHLGAGKCGPTKYILILGLGGLVVPFIARALLQSYGRKTTCLSFVSIDASSRRFHQVRAM